MPDETQAVTRSIVQETIQAFEYMRNGVVRAMSLLYQTKQSDEWQSRADSWGEFCERDLGISQSYASKLLTTWEHYVVEGGISPKELEGTDYERFYLARQLPGTTQDQVAMAKTLSRREIKETKNENTSHVHDVEYVPMCKSCKMRVYETNSAEA